MRATVAWVARHAVALFFIILILILAKYAAPPAIAWVNSQAEAAASVPAKEQSYAAALQAFDQYAAQRRREADAHFASLARQPERQLRARRALLDRLIRERANARLTQTQLAMAALSGSSDRILDHYKAGAELALSERERSYIDALLTTRASQQQRLRLGEQRNRYERQLKQSHRRAEAARARVARLNERPLANWRNAFCRETPIAVGCENYRAMRDAQKELKAAVEENQRAHIAIKQIDALIRKVAGANSAVETTKGVFNAQRSSLAQEVEELRQAAGKNWLLWLKRPVVEVLPTALIILAVAIFGPILIKIALYFLVAPIAARRPPIRLLGGETGKVRERNRSAVSQQVLLEEGHNLLVLPEAIQGTPHHARKWTQWLLSWRMPFSSLASGMVALTGVSVRRPDTVLVSATDNPLGEIAVVELPAGSALVIRPRTLRGVIEFQGRVRITRHWRLNHLAGWLTLQLRFLVVHGPCGLIVQGTRGVRLENAGPGRGINQASTIGFSAGLDYAVSRSEAFGAYLLGKQKLFNDSFVGGSGYYLYEEMPLEERRGGIWGRGLRGLGDAALTLVGL